MTYSDWTVSSVTFSPTEGHDAVGCAAMANSGKMARSIGIGNFRVEFWRKNYSTSTGSVGVAADTAANACAGIVQTKSYTDTLWHKVAYETWWDSVAGVRLYRKYYWDDTQWVQEAYGQGGGVSSSAPTFITFNTSLNGIYVDDIVVYSLT